jgi:tRNA-specific 2-thiouridylase
MSRVVLAMSGGVDSSVAARLLLDAGHEVVGVFMRHGASSPVACVVPAAAGQSATADRGGSRGRSLPIAGGRLDHKQGCCSSADAADARRVADRFGIPFYALDLQEDFGRIVDYFVDEYSSGRTPNPCVMCNNWLKFGKLFDYADGVGAPYVATGHYARLVPDAGGEPALYRGIDEDKDQSYVLFGVERPLLARMLLPVGTYRKPQVRARAAELGLDVAVKRDSQEICFVPSGRHAEFVRARRGEASTAGDIVTTDGRVVGRHDGIEGYTVGQRKGLGVALGEPYFVVRIEHSTRRVVLGRREELARRQFEVTGTNWLVDPPAGPLRCLVQIRSNSDAAPGTVEPLADGTGRVSLAEPRHGVAPGQAAVFYDGPRVLGGGWIA